MNRFVNLFAASLITLSLFACSKKEEAVVSEQPAATATDAASGAAATMTETASAASK